jgi:signal transduction histidine kinase
MVLRERTWRLTIPIHVLAFAFLYFATDRLLQREVAGMADAMAGSRLSQAADEVRMVALVHMPDVEEGHLFGALSEAHREINFRLFLAGGTSIGPESPPDDVERREMRDFLSAGEVQRFWLSDSRGGHEMRGLERVVGDADCLPCHRPGQTLAVASMTLDLTEVIGTVRSGSRRNLGILILVWAVALGLTTALVQRSVRRSTARFEAELAAAEGGDASTLPLSRDAVLDPVSGELHGALRRFLERQRKREAEVASRLAQTDQLASLGRLAAGLAHEIKNPLAGIQSALEILREDLTREENRGLCVEMLGELKRVDGIMQSLLTSAKPSPPKRRATDLHQLLEDLERLMAPSLRRRRIALETAAAAGPLEAEVDPAQIRQVLINLINNAADAIGEEGHVRLRAAPFPEGGGAILAVEDDGPGIPDEAREKVFTPFFTTKFSGTGLGLAIARSLVEQHNGSLQFETKPGEGTTFFVLLPANGAETEDDSAAVDAPRESD